MNSTLKKITFSFLPLIVLPHILFFLLSNNKAIGEDINRWLDIKRKTYGKVVGLSYLLIGYPEFRSLFYHRIGRIRSIFCRYLPGRTNLYLQTPSSKIEGGFYIGHGWGTVVNAKSIGKNCGVAQNCTIGSRNAEEPILENEVMVWAHSVVLGGITIGAKSHIGAGSVVVKDIEPESVVVAAKSRLIQTREGKVDKLL